MEVVCNMNFEEIGKKNAEFINQYSIERLIELLKQILLSSIFNPNKTLVEAINNINDIEIRLGELGIECIRCITSTKYYEKRYSIELSIWNIILSKENDMFKWETYSRIPIEALRIIKSQ